MRTIWFVVMASALGAGISGCCGADGQQVELVVVDPPTVPVPASDDAGGVDAGSGGSTDGTKGCAAYDACAPQQPYDYAVVRSQVVVGPSGYVQAACRFGDKLLSGVCEAAHGTIILAGPGDLANSVECDVAADQNQDAGTPSVTATANCQALR